MSEPLIDVRVTRRIDAPPARVYDAWLDPSRARRFLFATAAGEMVRAELDPRVGGRFTLVDRRDGVDVEHVGEYVALDPPRHLAFDFAVPAYSDVRTRVSVDVAPRDAGAEVTVVQHGTPAEVADRARAGWARTLDALAAALAAALDGA